MSDNPKRHSDFQPQRPSHPDRTPASGPGEQSGSSGAAASPAPKTGDRDQTPPTKPPPYKRPKILIPVGLIALVVILGGGWYWLHSQHYASTNDAFIDGYIAKISPRVPGPVVAMHIVDNQFVHKGQLLIEIDPTDYQVAVQQAQAQVKNAQGRLAQAQAQIGVSQAAVARADAQVDSAQVTLDNASQHLRRYESLDRRARSQQELDNLRTTEKTARSQLERARAKERSAKADVIASEAATNAAAGDLAVAQANLRNANVNLSYCRIRAPCDGRITERTVDVGDYLQTGQTMFSIVSPDVWVTANFKETAIGRMRPGQPVTIKVDAYPGRTFHGQVNSIQAGTGARFSVLPPENASGNFVKVVQRVPVKIVFEHGPNTNDVQLLAPGLSVTPTVKLR